MYITPPILKMSQVRSFNQNGKTHYRCMGKDNTCDSLSRIKGGLCGNCSGNVRVRNGQYAVGTIFTIGDTRYRMRENGREILCATPTCMTRACAGNMCKMHAAAVYNGREGAIALSNGKELRTNGFTYRMTSGQSRHVCAHGDCITVIKEADNYCTKHIHIAAVVAAFAAAEEAAAEEAAADDTAGAEEAAADADTAADNVTVGETDNVADGANNDDVTEGNNDIFCDHDTNAACDNSVHVPVKATRSKKGVVDVFDSREHYDAIIADTSRVFRTTQVTYPQWVYKMTYTESDGIKRVIGEIFTNSNGDRRMICVSRKNNKTLATIPICNGQDGTCKSDAKTGGKCKTCANGNDGVGAHRRELAGNTEGQIVTCSNGVRYRMMGGQNRQLCRGDDNKCMNARSEGVYCHAHHHKGIPRLKGAKKGDTYIRDGYRAIHNGKQFVKLCNYNEGECKVAVVVNGMCKKHAPEWHCQYVDCTKIRVNSTQYCKIHEGGVVNKREMWKLELAVMDWCDLNNIRYNAQYTVSATPSLMPADAPESVQKQKNYRFDFYLPDHNLYIEVDGTQHFNSIAYWNGDEGLIHRQYIDDAKSKYAIQSGSSIIRAHAKDGASIFAYLTRVFDIIRANQRPVMYLSSSYANETRYVNSDIEYVIVRVNVGNDDRYSKIIAKDDEDIDD